MGFSPFHYNFQHLEDVEKTLLTRDKVLSILKTNWEEAQEKMKATIDKNNLPFSIGKWVYVKLQPYKQTVFGKQHHNYQNVTTGPIR